MPASGSTMAWFLAPPSACTRLPCASARLVDVLGDRGGADERDRGHVRVGEQRVDGLLVAVHHVEHAVGQPGLGPQLGHVLRGRGVALGRLEHERVAGGDGHRVHPHRHHRREVERRDPDADPERLAEGEQVDAAGDLVGELALEQRGDAAGELDDLQAALHLARGVREHLAVLVGDDLGDLLGARVDQLAEVEQHLRALRQRRLATTTRRRPRRSARRRRRPRWRPAAPRPAARRWPGSTPGSSGWTCRWRASRRSSG